MGKLYKEAVDKMIPERKAKVRKESLPWIGTEIRKLIYNRSRALENNYSQQMAITGINI